MTIFTGCICRRPWTGPAPRGKFDLSLRDIHAMLPKMAGLPIRVEHKPIDVGRVLNSHLNARGEWYVTFEIDDGKNVMGKCTSRFIQEHGFNHLSLLHIPSTHNEPEPKEVSIVWIGKRDGSNIELVHKGTHAIPLTNRDEHKNPIPAAYEQPVFASILPTTAIMSSESIAPGASEMMQQQQQQQPIPATPNAAVGMDTTPNENEQQQQQQQQQQDENHTAVENLDALTDEQVMERMLRDRIPSAKLRARAYDMYEKQVYRAQQAELEQKKAETEKQNTEQATNEQVVQYMQGVLGSFLSMSPHFTEDKKAYVRRELESGKHTEFLKPLTQDFVAASMAVKNAMEYQQQAHETDPELQLRIERMRRIFHKPSDSSAQQQQQALPQRPVAASFVPSRAPLALLPASSYSYTAPNIQPVAASIMQPSSSASSSSSSQPQRMKRNAYESGMTHDTNGIWKSNKPCMLSQVLNDAARAMGQTKELGYAFLPAPPRG